MMKTQSIITTILFVFSFKVMGQENDTIWHPKEFRIIYPQMRLILKLPYEEDRTGFRNILFQHKETKEIFMLDKEHRTHHRIYTNFFSDDYPNVGPEKYDVILLYNNGKYIKYDDVIFGKNSFIAIDMSECVVQSSNYESQQWLNMRAFLTTLGGRRINTEYENRISTYSSLPIKIRGYLFRENGWAEYTASVSSGDYHSRTRLPSSKHDGYFEIGLNGSCQSLFFISGLTHYPLEILAPNVDCGLFIVLTETPLSKETLYFPDINRPPD